MIFVLFSYLREPLICMIQFFFILLTVIIRLLHVATAPFWLPVKYIKYRNAKVHYEALQSALTLSLGAESAALWRESQPNTFAEFLRAVA